MRTVHLNQTDISVSPLCLGTVNFGTTLSRRASKEQLSRFFDLGGNFIDTARIYGAWGNEGPALSERIIGEWFEETKKRSNTILSTKGAHPDWGAMHIPRLKTSDIEYDLDESLRNLKTDYIDLYFLHRDDTSIPVSDILTCLEKAKRAGKIRYYGCSNWSLPRIAEAAEYAKKEGIAGFVCNQLMWSLADINLYGLPDKTFVPMDTDTYAFHRKTRMNAMAYMSIAKGYFMRRMNKEALPTSVTECYSSKVNDDLYALIESQSGNKPQEALYFSLAYLMFHPFPSMPIASFDNDDQLDDAMKYSESSISHVLLKKMGKMKKFINKTS